MLAYQMNASSTSSFPDQFNMTSLPMNSSVISNLSTENETSFGSPDLHRNSNRSPLEAITTVINNFMAPTIPAAPKRKRAVKRPYGESLTSEDALARVEEEENTRKKRTSTKKTPNNQSAPRKR